MWFVTQNAPGWSIFFLEVMPVAPSRFRPPMTMGDQQFEHPQNVFLTKIMNLNEQLQSAAADEADNGFSLQRKIQTWIQLQEVVNTLIDSSKSEKKNDTSGIRQLLEKKEGLFRKNMVRISFLFLFYTFVEF
jgi:DNA-directed RNA polymerase I subunit RPA1